MNFNTENECLKIRELLNEMKRNGNKFYHNFLAVWKSGCVSNYHMELLIEAELEVEEYVLSSQEILGSQYSQYQAKKLGLISEIGLSSQYKKEKIEKEKEENEFNNKFKKFENNHLNNYSQSQTNNFEEKNDFDKMCHKFNKYHLERFSQSQEKSFEKKVNK